MEIINKFAQTGTKNSVTAITDHQTRGMGREKRTWHDAPGCSVMFSALFHIQEVNIACFADLTALSTCRTLNGFTGKKEIQIQYPNDIVWADQKLGGILVKNLYDDNFHYLGTAIGIGINVHYTLDGLLKFSTDYPAVSVDTVTQSCIKRQDILVQLLKSLLYLDTETDIIAVNPQAGSPYESQWKKAQSLMGRQIILMKANRKIREGKVTGTGLGKGIRIETHGENAWYSLFESDMKVRIVS
jgi:BirA family biotin operon repressor/biotin-[acetyl-CoA-carboxylase] ligase